MFLALGNIWKNLCGAISCLFTGQLKRFFMVAGSGLFLLISQVFLTYFFIISLKISHFPTISQLFHSYFSFLNNFSLISQLFLISRRCFSFLSYTSQLFLSYFSVTSRLFSSESPDISAIYNWLISALTSRRLLHGVTVKSE